MGLGSGGSRQSPLLSLLNLICAEEHWPDNDDAKKPAVNKIAIKFPKAQVPSDSVKGPRCSQQVYSKDLQYSGGGGVARTFRMVWQSGWGLDNMIPA